VLLVGPKGVDAVSHERNTVADELARELARKGDWSGYVVVGLPKGGAVVGARVALELGIAYECVPVCRIGMPCSPQLTLGAIDPDGFVTLDPHSELTRYQVTRSRGDLADALRQEADRCRGDREPVDVANRDVIVVDDAADTHMVAQAAAEYLRRHGAGRLAFATPVASELAVQRVEELYDNVIIGRVVQPAAIAGFYTEAVPDDDVIHECMTRAWEASPEKAGART
jgi:putative phosphoribosyl transferase